MNNFLSGFGSCGIEVSTRTLLVEQGSEGQAVARCEFPNTAEGHKALLCFLERSGGGVWVRIEPTGLQGLGLALYPHHPPKEVPPFMRTGPIS